LNSKISKILKYLYTGTNIILALYILINTSFLQTTLYQYIAEQNGLTKVEHPVPLNNHIIIEKQLSQTSISFCNDGDKALNLEKLYYLLAVISFSQIFTPKNSSIKQTFLLIAQHFKKIVDFFRPLICVSGIAMRAPPASS
jgi:hypothetical protein